jgi:hypothetical protein
VHHFPELSGASEFFQAAPEFRAVFLLDFGAYLYQVEFARVAGTDCLAMRLLLFVIHER